MRTKIINYQGTSITISYLEAISFAFNRELIIIKGFGNVSITTIKVSISGNGKQFTDIRESSSDIFKIDISYYLQQMFDILTNPGKVGVSNTGIALSIGVDIGGTFFGFSTHCIWGAISPGETFNPSHEITYFTAFPFIFSVFARDGLPIYKSIDGGNFVLQDGDTYEGINNISPSGNAQREIVYRFGGSGDDVINTFDYTFDYTFRLKPGIAPEKEIRLVVNDCSDGVYLRWIDRQGFYRYYLVSQRNITFQTEADDKAVNMDYEAFGRWFCNVKRQNRNETQTVGGFASLVNPNDFFILTSLFTSPIVWMFAYNVDDPGEQDWVPVQIAPASNVMTSAALQDMNINIILPATPIQKL
ncbi:MAG: hypothetical protein LBV41_12870 [Cytophagaceae bacterium]|jgi:hypothetical protein|nr:hypothetical protein [Cytophagaceae bacterium]